MGQRVARASAADRACMRRLGQGMAVAKRLDRPAGTLREALRQMWWIERSRTVGGRPQAGANWADRDSNLAYLAAVRQMATVERSAMEAASGGE